MSETQYPTFDAITDDFSLAYMHYLLTPYVDVLKEADTMDQLTEWISSAISGDNVDEPLEILSKIDDTQQGKLAILQYIGDLILENQPQNITPWTLASYRDTDLLIELFGPPEQTVPITVIVGSKSYTHDLTYELTHGLLHGLQNDNKFTVQLLGKPLTLDYFPDSSENTKYSIIIDAKVIGFDTADFIQGICTAAEWRNFDPHKITSDFVQNDDGAKIPLKF